jgi:hypothetical protein
LSSLFFAFCLLLSGKLSGHDEVSYDGYVGMRANYEYNDRYANLYTLAKIEIELELTEDIEAQIDIRGNSNDSEIKLKEIHALFKRDPDFLIKIGNIKKCFGIEELNSKEDLYTIEESLINDYLSPFGYVGRDPGIQVYREYKDKGMPYSYYFVTSINQSGILIINNRVSYHNFFGSYCLGLDGIYRRSLSFAENEYPSNSYAISIDLSRKFGSLYTDLEVFFGMDPIETQLNDFYLDDRDVLFIGSKWLLAYYFDLNNIIKGIEPLFLCGILSPDTRYLSVNKVELLLGVNIYLDKNVRFALNGDLILTNNKYNIHDRAIAAGSKVLLDLRLKW